MSIQELITSGQNITIAVTAQDLDNFGRSLIEQARRELYREIADQKNEAYYTAEEVMKILNVKSRCTLWAWKKSGYLLPSKVGRLLRYRKSDIDKILKEKVKP